MAKGIINYSYCERASIMDVRSMLWLLITLMECAAILIKKMEYR